MIFAYLIYCFHVCSVPGVGDVRESRFGLHVCHGRILWKAHGVTQSAMAHGEFASLGSETKWEEGKKKMGCRGFSIMMSYDMSISNGWQPDFWLEFLYHNVTCTLHTLSWVLCLNVLTQSPLFSGRVKNWIASPFPVFGGMCLHGGLCHPLDSWGSIGESPQEPFRMNCGDQLCVTWLMMQRGKTFGETESLLFVCVCHASHLFVLVFFDCCCGCCCHCCCLPWRTWWICACQFDLII